MANDWHDDWAERGLTAANLDAAPTADRLRDDIDSGLAHDKVAQPDPAAAPLGTDDEASGTPPTPEQVATARRQEAGRTGPEELSASQVASQTACGPNMTMIGTIVGVVVVAILLAIAF
jgi:hypothetical protein